MIDNVFLSEVVATRLSHDIIGNIGAVANAMELLNDSDEGDDNSEVFKILNYSSDVLTKRMKFFRLCFGLNNSSVKLEEAEQIIKDYFTTLGTTKNKIKVDLEISSPKVYKLIMPAAMMMADTLVKGGKIAIKQTEHNLMIAAVSEVPLDENKIKNIDLILDGKEAQDNHSVYAPLYYLLNYLEGSRVPLKRLGNSLMIGD